MKIVKLTALGKNAEDIPNVRFVIGPGTVYRWGEENKATLINSVDGIKLVKETPDEIDRLIEGGADGSSK